MTKHKILISALLALFAWGEVAQAASISTRVRVLEGKVSKQDRQIKAESAARKAYENRVNQKLSSVDDLQIQVEKIVKQMEAEKKGKGEDKRYMFP